MPWERLSPSELVESAKGILTPNEKIPDGVYLTLSGFCDDAMHGIKSMIKQHSDWQMK